MEGNWERCQTCQGIFYLRPQEDLLQPRKRISTVIQAHNKTSLRPGLAHWAAGGGGQSPFLHVMLARRGRGWDKGFYFACRLSRKQGTVLLLYSRQPVALSESFWTTQLPQDMGMRELSGHCLIVLSEVMLDGVQALFRVCQLKSPP